MLDALSVTLAGGDEAGWLHGRERVANKNGHSSSGGYYNQGMRYIAAQIYAEDIKMLGHRLTTQTSSANCRIAVSARCVRGANRREHILLMVTDYWADA